MGEVQGIRRKEDMIGEERNGEGMKNRRGEDRRRLEHVRRRWDTGGMTGEGMQRKRTWGEKIASAITAVMQCYAVVAYPDIIRQVTKNFSGTTEVWPFGTPPRCPRVSLPPHAIVALMLSAVSIHLAPCPDPCSYAVSSHFPLLCTFLFTLPLLP